MSKPKGVLFFGIAEITIGTATLAAVLTSLLFSYSEKPLNVLIFVITTSVISIYLGVTILKYKIHSLHMLLFFATMIILSKALIFTGIISLHGALETNLPEPLKNIFSLIYHAAILVYFNLPKVRARFK
jgi:hypothetical protein